MASFKIGDKVVAPTVFTGVGEVINVSIDTVKVKDTNDVCYNFTTCGKVSIYAELPALHHFEEQDTKMNFLEAMQALQEGKKVFNDECSGLVYSLHENDLYKIDLGYNNECAQEAHVLSWSEILSDWYIYEEQEVIEWSPKKYESVAIKSTRGVGDLGRWQVAAFKEIQYDGFYVYGKGGQYDCCIPLNKETEHLLHSTKEHKVKYIIKETNNG